MDVTDSDGIPPSQQTGNTTSTTPIQQGTENPPVEPSQYLRKIGRIAV